MPATVVVMDTSLGSVTIELDGDKAPLSVANFLSYVDDKFYDGTIFHRVIADFMIQGGGFASGLRQKTTKANVKNESTNGLSNKRGTLAMARTSSPDSATAQFFVNVKDNDFLDRAKAADKVGYCVFGKVTAGLDVVDKIRAVKTGSKGGFQDVPLTEVTINSIRRA
jgi:cyclophilin family peptidyl-prolyl cis-trans isomerase